MDIARFKQRLHAWSFAESQLRHNAFLLVYLVALFALFTALFAFVQYGTPHLADNDGFYHIRMGQLMREHGLAVDFPWLPLTILNGDAFYDHHLLYHLYLALFVGDGTPDRLIAGAKLASVIMPALACVAIWFLLHTQRVPLAALWSVGLFAVSEAFLYRMSMPRAQAASLLLLVLALHWLLQRRYALLLPLGFLYVWLYNAFPLLLVVAGVSVAATWLTERRIDWPALAYPLVGITVGLVINPYFPADISFIVHHLVPKLGQPTTSVGSEWYPYQTWTLVENTGGALGVWLLGVLALGWRERRIDRATLTALLLSIVFGLMLFKARRFVEYFPAFALIFAALATAPLFAAWMGKGRRFWVVFLCIGTLAAPLGSTLAQAREGMAQSTPATMYAGAAGWLRDHTPAGSLVFQTDWDDFPRLFFYNTLNHYIVGLDPTYMQLYDAQLYDEWVAITQGKIADPAATIRSRFGASYVLSDHHHTSFLQRAAHDKRMMEVYRDNDAVIFAIAGE